MVHSREGSRPASSQDATPSAKSVPELKLRDGRLTVTLFSRTTGEGDTQWFAVPERSYRDSQQEWVSTHTLHPDDLLPMAQLLQQLYSEHRVTIADDSKKSA
jgi:hypothetical protein